MKRTLIFVLLAISFSLGIGAKTLRCVATYPFIGELLKEIGAERVLVTVLAKGSWDPHQIVPRPSFIADLLGADLLVINGAQLEIGWLPQLLQQAGNGKLLPGQKGFLDLSTAVTLIDVPHSVSRDQGDIHPDGNPHFALDPHLLTTLAEAVSARLTVLDRAGAAVYAGRLERFREGLAGRLADWERRMAVLKGRRVIVYHRLFDYFLRRYGLEIQGLIEPLPGISPGARHLTRLVEEGRGIGLVLTDVFHSPQAARRVADGLGAQVVILPHDVGAAAGTDTLLDLYEMMVTRLER